MTEPTLPADLVLCPECGWELEKGPYPPHWRHVASRLIVCVPEWSLAVRTRRERQDAY